jgi:pimeloyl-ACP methyl ester carboxylesterase
MSPAHRTISTNGIEVHVAEQGEGPLVVLLHGFPESWYSWRHQLDALAAAGFHAVAPDMRGYGGTTAPDDHRAYTYLHLVGDVVGLLGALGEGPAVVVGHDWGAPVAWHTALFRPDLVRGVAALSVPYLPRGDVDVLTGLSALVGERNYQMWFQEPGVAEAVLDADPERFLRLFMHALSGENEAGTDLSYPDGVELVDTFPEPAGFPAWLTEDDLAFYVAEFRRTGFHGGLNWYRTAALNHELLAPFHGAPIVTPALFVGGERDTVVNWPGMRDAIAVMSAWIPNLTKAVLLEGCGHWTQQERPAEIDALLLEFIATLH